MLRVFSLSGPASRRGPRGAADAEWPLAVPAPTLQPRCSASTPRPLAGGATPCLGGSPWPLRRGSLPPLSPPTALPLRPPSASPWNQILRESGRRRGGGRQPFCAGLRAPAGPCKQVSVGCGAESGPSSGAARALRAPGRRLGHTLAAPAAISGPGRWRGSGGARGPRRGSFRSRWELPAARRTARLELRWKMSAVWRVRG